MASKRIVSWHEVLSGADIQMPDSALSIGEDGLYLARRDCFISTTDVFGGVTPVAVTAAGSLSVFRRFAFEEIEADDGATLAIPDELRRYGGVFAEIRRNLGRDVFERATYRFSDGQAVGRVLSSDRLDYFFRGLRDRQEVPAAIRCRLPASLRLRDYYAGGSR